jgi:hypothetical protein
MYGLEKSRKFKISRDVKHGAFLVLFLTPLIIIGLTYWNNPRYPEGNDLSLEFVENMLAEQGLQQLLIQIEP